MFGLFVMLVGLVIAAGLLASAYRLPSKLRGGVAVLALVVLVLGFVLGSVRHIGADEVGIVTKHIGMKRLEGGAYIATAGEQGVQAEVLAPGWHFGFWPGVYEIREVPLTVVESGMVGLLEARDGLPLEPGQMFAAEWPASDVQRMLDAEHFLTAGKGRKGAQASVLTPGKYRLNTELFKVRTVPATEIKQGEVGVLKANFGLSPSKVVEGVAGALEPGKDGHEVDAEGRLHLAGPGEMGVRAVALPPGKYPLNTDAFTLVELWTTQMISHYTAAAASRSKAGESAGAGEEREIVVRTSDGFTFPVDVRVEYVIEPKNAPIVVAKLGDDEGDRFRNALDSAVRAIFRNNAEKVRALDYVQQRSQQESQSLDMLAKQMSRFGVTVTAVRIGNVGDEKTLGTLLKTQTDREIAKQELVTYQEQQKAAEQEKLLNKARQEAEEERRLATAAYAVKIATETARQRITEAEAEAESIRIRAEAQADAYDRIAQQIGAGNAAMLELLKIVGERNIQIAPRVMVVGDRGGSGGGSATGHGTGTALMGTMLDWMVDRTPVEEPEPKAADAQREPARPTSGASKAPGTTRPSASEQSSPTRSPPAIRPPSN